MYMYHNNSAAADNQNAAAVWADSFGSWHLDEDPGPGLAGDILDSSAQSNHGTAGAGQTGAVERGGDGGGRSGGSGPCGA